jgi:hypothetical protein
MGWGMGKKTHKFSGPGINIHKDKNLFHGADGLEGAKCRVRNQVRVT